MAASSDYRLIRDILTATRAALASAPIRYIAAAPTGDFAADANRLHEAELHEQALVVGQIAIAVVHDARGRILATADRYIALYPPWTVRPAYGATVILHEGFHYQNPARFGSSAMHAGFFDASRFQGFVSELTGLPFRRGRVLGGVRSRTAAP